MTCCNEGHNYNIGFINDCRLSLGICCYGMSKYKEAKQWIKLFISKHNPYGIYSKFYGKKVLASIIKHEQ